MINKIVIAGGGFAGYITALLIKSIYARRYNPQCDIQVIESTKIGTVGVGEGVSQQLPNILDTLNINPWEFLNATNGTFKITGRFDNWNYDGEKYHHVLKPILSLTDIRINNADHHYLHFIANEIPFDDIGFNNLAKVGKVPFKKVDDTYMPVTMPKGYNETSSIGSVLGMHMEAQDSIHYLRKIVKERGITVTDGEIVDWELEQDTGYLKTLILKDEQKISGDFFFDCTGFRRLIFGKIYEEEYIDYSKYIPQNSVSLAREINNKEGAGIPYKEGEGPWPFSIFDAQKHGWMFKIPLQHRIGSGYVYSDKLVDDDTIKQEQIKYWKDRGYDVESVRTLKWKPGKFKRTVMKNCFAMGLSEGFTDPLDGGALIIGLRGLQDFLNQMTPNMTFDNFNYKQFNKWAIDAYEWLIEFVCFCHLSRREDSEYWRYFKEDDHIPFNLSDKLLQWAKNPIRSHDFSPDIRFPFGMGSWLAIGQHNNYIGSPLSAARELLYPDVNPSELAKIHRDIKHIKKTVEKHSTPMMDVLKWSKEYFK